MIRLFLFVTIVVTIIFMSGCKTLPSETMSFEKVSYIREFPESFSLNGGRLLDLDLIGVQSLSVQDSLLIVSTLDNNGFWSFFSLPDHMFLGNYLHKGKSNGEFIISPRVHNQYFYSRDGRLFSLIYDFYTGKLSEFDISGTLVEKRPVIKEKDMGLETHLFNLVCMDSTTFLCRAVNVQMTELSRYISGMRGKSIPENMEILNGASVNPGSDVNILGTYCRYNPDKDIVVEAALDLSVINLYPVKSGKGLSICPESALDKICDVEEVDRPKKKVAYCHLVSYDEFFAALYYGDTAENIHYGKARAQRIQFFDWDGKPLAEVTLDYPANSFDIDFHQNQLYTLNYDKDEIRVYDIRDVLDCLSNID